MNTLKERLEKAMAGPTPVKPADLARACGVRPPSVSDWLSGKTKKLEGANLLAASEFLHVRPWWLAAGKGPMRESDRVSATESKTEVGTSTDVAVISPDVKDSVIERSERLAAQIVAASTTGLLDERGLTLMERHLRAYVGAGAATISESGKASELRGRLEGGENERRSRRRHAG